MIKKLLILATSLSNTLLLVFMLSLGSQNLSNKHSISLGITSTEEYPSGFLIGMSIALGSLSGGLTSFFLLPSRAKKYF